MKNLLTMCCLTFLSVAICICLGGCASIISGKSQEVSFDSQPDGVTVDVNGKVLGKTPFTVTIARKSDQSITFTKDGYKPTTMRLETSINGWFWGNIVIGGLLGSTTDGLSGARPPHLVMVSKTAPHASL